MEELELKLSKLGPDFLDMKVDSKIFIERIKKKIILIR